MSRTLKWVLGILAVLVVIAVVASGVWIWQNRTQMMLTYRPNATQPNFQTGPSAPNGQSFPFGPRGYDNDGNRPMQGWGFRGPMMGRGRIFRSGPFGMGFLFLGGLPRLIIPLGLLALVAFAFYQLGKRSLRSTAPAALREPSQSDTSTPSQNPPKAD